MEKLKQLSKYIEPLRRMINKIDKNEGKGELPPMRGSLSPFQPCGSRLTPWLLLSFLVFRPEEGLEQDEESAEHSDRPKHQVRTHGCGPATLWSGSAR